VLACLQDRRSAGAEAVEKGHFRERSLRQIKAARPRTISRVLPLAPVLALILAFPTLGAAQPAPSVRLLLPPLAPAPADGRYVIDDQVRFMIDVEDDHIRLRFVDNDEIFYLKSEPAPLGGRVLKYDTGEVALQVAGWGGLTLYTDADRGGIPAERSDEDADGFEPPAVAARDVRGFALGLAQGLAVTHDFGIGFAADWDAMAQDDVVRALAVDSMRNAAYALARLGASPDHGTIAEKFHLIRVASGPEPGSRMQDGALVVSYTPEAGPSARPSSRAIARVLAGAF
jgi:hypothetical protein